MERHPIFSTSGIRVEGFPYAIVLFHCVATENIVASCGVMADRNSTQTKVQLCQSSLLERMKLMGARFEV